VLLVSIAAVPSADSNYWRARRRAERILRELGMEIRSARLSAGSSQASVAAAARISRSNVSRIESAHLLKLSIREAILLADAVGLNLSIKAYPGREPTRDAGHARRLKALLANVTSPLGVRLEVPLPPRAGALEQRAWDALISATDGETGVELEIRLHDMQSQTRRILLKWRDSGVERLLLVIADSDANRRAIRLYPDYLSALRRLRRADVVAALKAGRRPPTGYVLF
jgi:transcriptional regulator with XRE-family HTH domain